MAIPPAAVRHAASHHGIVTSAVLQSGLSQRQVRRLTKGGQLEQLYRGVYRMPGAPRSWEQLQLAACLTTGGVASHRAALRLWDTASGTRRPAACPLEVTVGRHSAPSPSGVVVHRATELELGVVPARQQIPVTSPLRMLVDLGAVVDQDQVAAALERLVIFRLITVEAVRREVAAAARPGRRGVRAARAAVADWPMGDARPDSKLEVDFARLVRSAGLPQPEYQYELIVGSRRRRLDVAYPELRIAIELDGFTAHSNRDAFQDDRRRNNDLSEAGWTVIHFTWHDVTQRPDYVIATVRSMLYTTSEPTLATTTTLGRATLGKPMTRNRSFAFQKFGVPRPAAVSGRR